MLFIWIFIHSLLQLSPIGDAQPKGEARSLHFYQKEQNGKTVIYCRNASDKTFNVTLTFNCPSHSTSSASPLRQQVGPFGEKDLLEMTPVPGRSGAGCDMSYQYEEVLEISNIEAPDLGRDIVVFSQPHCDRCHTLRQALEKQGAAFVEKNVKLPENNRLMWAKLQAHGFKGGTVYTPVVAVGDALYYDIDDVEELARQLAKAK